MAKKKAPAAKQLPSKEFVADVMRRVLLDCEPAATSPQNAVSFFTVGKGVFRALDDEGYSLTETAINQIDEMMLDVLDDRTFQLTMRGKIYI